MEHTSEDVYIGKLISENTYIREKHEIHIENREHEISIDFFDRKRKILHEVKKSKKNGRTPYVAGQILSLCP